MTEFKVVACLWIDACSYRNETLENIDDMKGTQRLTIGIIRRDTKDYVLIQNDIDPYALQKMNYCIKIPKSLILKMYEHGSIEINEIVKGD